MDALRHFVRDASRVHVDHAADCTGAVEQSRRALQDFHALRDEGVDRDGVVAAADGDVKGIDLFLHDAHPRAAEAVNDGAPRTHAVGTVVDARLVAHGRADVVHGLAFELVGVEHVARLCEPVARERVRQDDDLLDLGRLFLVGCVHGGRGHAEASRHGREKSLHAFHCASPEK